MPWCPKCKLEYESGITTCPDCGAVLVDTPPEDEPELVVILHAATANEARVAEATLKAEGIDAFVAPPDVVMPQYGNVVGDVTNELDVLVAPENAERAREILNAPPVSDAELEAFEEGTES